MSILGILGAGGAGKSTLLRRLGATLRQTGKQVFLGDVTQRPKVADVVTSLRGFPERAILLIDNAPLLGFVFLELIDALAQMDLPPIVVFAARYNLFERQLRNLAANPALTLYEVPDLSDPDINALAILRRQLRGLLHQSQESGRVVARHPIIAEYIVTSVATRVDLLESYKRLLSALAHDIYGGEGRRRRSWRLFVRLINHSTVYERFRSDIDLARAIYESIAEWFRRDGHFWLQYANLELEYGEPQFARVHLAHAEGLMPDNDQMLTTKAHLALRESLECSSLDEATTLRGSAQEILFEQIGRLGADDEYPYHVYLSQSLAWIHRWGALLDDRGKTQFLENLDNLAQAAVESHPLSRRVRNVALAIRREYLALAL